MLPVTEWEHLAIWWFSTFSAYQDIQHTVLYLSKCEALFNNTLLIWLSINRGGPL